MGLLLCPVVCCSLLFIASLVMGDNAVMSGGMQTGAQAKLLCDQDGAAPACGRGKHLLNGRVVTLLTWKNAISFNDNWAALDTKPEGQPVAVRVSQVKGDFILTSNANLVVVSLQLTNLTRFTITNHTQDLSLLEELIVSDSPEFDASSLQQLGKLPSLVTLQMAGTALATLSNRKLKQVLEEMPALQYLDISFSKLHHLEPSTFQENSLQTLNVAGNELISLSLDGGLLQHLVHLNISHCSMEQLRIENVPEETMQTNLSLVDLSHNYLTSLPASFMNIISDSHVRLNISENLWNKSFTLCSLYHLWSYATKHPDMIQGAQNLSSCFRPDEALKKCGWEECPATCSCDPRTKTVNCSSSDLKTVPYLGPSDAEILLLKNNTLLNMSGIESPVWCKLRTVIADGNKISSIMPPDTMGHCICSDHDDFDDEEGNCLPQSLKKLSLIHNKITNFSNSDCKLLYSLQELHLSDNKVEHLRSHVCSSLEHLEVLLLDNNAISDLKEQDVAPYPNLRELDLSFNKMVILPYRIFEFVPRLTGLNVSNNNLMNISTETSFPETPFTYKVTNFPNKLDLSNNKFEKIDSVLGFKYIPKLKELLVDNNPWKCHCEIVNRVMAQVFQKLRHTAMVNAVESAICQEPSDMKGIKMNDRQISEVCSKNCTKKDSPSNSELLATIVAILIIVILLGLVIQITFQKIRQKTFGILWLPPARNDATHRRNYSVCIVHAWQDNEMVKADLVDPLKNLGYSVLWNDSAYPPGDNVSASIERAVTNSRRMLVVASNNLMIYENAKRIIERGLDEERSVPGFKVVALVMDDLPQRLYSVLYEIVVKRTHITKMNSNYIRAICNILPAPGAMQNIITFTETDLYCFLLQQWEKAKKRKHQRAQLQDIFPVQNSDPCAGNARSSNTSFCESGIAVASIADDFWEAVCSRSQRKCSSVTATEEQLQACSNHYTLQISCEDEEVIQVEGFSQVNSEGHCTHL
ncbi:hypothetical protein O3P69_015512 [Scylla paramamosain]|uniref:TIR domain-containing protein n=1 Tax=Scylla paramamosain TaxID=85552 RepID=A0AAW0T8P8_SCYPA